MRLSTVREREVCRTTHVQLREEARSLREAAAAAAGRSGSGLLAGRHRPAYPHFRIRTSSAAEVEPLSLPRALMTLPGASR